MRTRNSPRSLTARRLLACSTVLLLYTAQAQTQSQSETQRPDTGWIDQDRLEAGEILTDFGGDSRFRELIRTAALVDAAPESIWKILQDCESAPEYVPHVISCELVESRDQGRTQIFRQEIKYAWFLPRFEHVFSLSYQPHKRIDVQRVSGPIEHLEGIWWLLPAVDETTLLLYELEFRPGLPLPRFAISAAVTKDIPIILAEVRRRAQATPQPDL